MHPGQWKDLTGFCILSFLSAAQQEGSDFSDSSIAGSEMHCEHAKQIDKWICSKTHHRFCRTKQKARCISPPAICGLLRSEFSRAEWIKGNGKAFLIHESEAIRRHLPVSGILSGRRSQGSVYPHPPGSCLHAADPGLRSAPDSASFRWSDRGNLWNTG